MDKLAEFGPPAFFWLLAMAAQLSGYTNTPAAMSLAIIGTAWLLVSLGFRWHTARIRNGKAGMLPQYLILGGLTLGVISLCLVVGGYAWQLTGISGRDSSFTKTPGPRITSAVKMTITNVRFVNEPDTQFIVNMHLANLGAPSTLKDFVLSIYFDGKLFQQFPPREANVGPGLGPTLQFQRGLILRTEPLEQGKEIDASVSYQIANNAKDEVGKSGMVFRMNAIDIEGKLSSAEYKMP